MCRRFLSAFPAIALVLLVLARPVHSAEPPKPNVVFILADDLGYSDLGCYGGEIETPNLDALATSGLRYTQFYNTARCWPSRAALLTGYYPQAVNRDPQGTRPRWAALLPQLLAPAGYRSYHSGKWHVDGKVLDGGFLRSYTVSDHDRYFAPKHHQLDDKALAPPKPDENYYATTAVAERSLEWLGEHAKQHPGEPFFLYTAFISPHFPLHAPAEEIAKYRARYEKGWDEVRKDRWERIKKLGLVSGELPPPEADVRPAWNPKEEELTQKVGPGEIGRAIPWSELTPDQRKHQTEKMAIHAAMVGVMDREVGRIIDKLKQMGVYENTLILFASDNGASAEQLIRGDGHSKDAPAGSGASYLGLGPGWSTVANTPFRRHKSWTHEGGIATPLVAHWPKGIAARGELRTTPGHLVDIAPTLLELAGQQRPAQFAGEARPAWPGASLVKSFAQDEAADARPAIFFKHIGNRGLRKGDWKIVSSGADGEWELYDLKQDRGETRNLAAKHPDKVQELAALWKERDLEYARQGATGGSKKGSP